MYKTVTTPYTSFINFSSAFGSKILVRTLPSFNWVVNTPIYKVGVRLRSILSLYIPENNPMIRRLNRFVWRNLFLIILCGIHLTYLVKWRYDVFIDRANKTLYTHTHLIQLDNKIR